MEEDATMTYPPQAEGRNINQRCGQANANAHATTQNHTEDIKQGAFALRLIQSMLDMSHARSCADVDPIV